MQSKVHTDCCPRFHPKGWDEKAVIWDGKDFLKDKVGCFFHIPRDFGKVVVKNNELMKAAGAKNPHALMLCEHRSLWSMDVYFATDKEVPNANNVKLSGRFITKVFEGPYKNAGKWTKEMKSYVKSKNKEIKRLLYWYTTCPKCAEVYGKNYVVIFAEV
jgi:hypothetical protein